METTERVDLITEIAECIGEEATAKLVEEYGGGKVYVPQSTSPDRNLAKIIGVVALEQLAKTYGGMMLHIPAGEARMREARNSDVIEARRNGATIRQLCQMFKLTERTVYRILSPQE